MDTPPLDRECYQPLYQRIYALEILLHDLLIDPVVARTPRLRQVVAEAELAISHAHAVASLLSQGKGVLPEVGG